MVSLAVDFIMPGTVIDSPIYDKRGQQLLDAKTPFTQEIIERLKQARIDRIHYYQGTGSETPQVVGAPAPEAKRSPLLDQKICNLATGIFRDLAGNIQAGQFIQTTALHHLVDVLYKIINSRPVFPDALLAEKQQTNLFSDHALNTCILSMIIAVKHSFDAALVKQIGLGAFLHDIGKLKLSRQVLEKTEGYSPQEIEELKKHTTYGFELIKLNGQLSSLVRKIVLLHHEATNGSGYPLGLSEKDVGYYPYIVSLANIFDNLTTNKPYRTAYSLKDTLGMLIQSAGKKLPPYLVQNFIKNISRNRTPDAIIVEKGDFVMLNTQEVAYVIAAHSNAGDQPLVRLIRNEKGVDFKPPQDLDLNKTASRKITEVLSQEVQRMLAKRYKLD